MDKYCSAGEWVENAFKQVESASRVGSKDLVIWGGMFPAKQLGAFLAAWGLALSKRLTWRMIEYVNQFELCKAGKKKLALEADRLERARFFGVSGDLELRRDGDQFCWRFLGEANLKWKPLPRKFAGKDFWKEQNPSPPKRARKNSRQAEPSSPGFREVTMRYYQWRGTERRVDTSWLKQAGLREEGVYLIQKQYLRNGHAEFVRYVGFDGEAQNG